MGTVSGLQTTMFLTCIVLCITITHATVISRPNGGQILRNAAALSCLLHQPIHVGQIRAGRDKPGLRPQHLMGLQVICDICGGSLEGGEVQSCDITLTPGQIQMGSFLADTKTAGSTCLLIQAALPCLFFAKGETELVLRGGTNADMAPPVDYFTWVFQPIASRFGVQFECDIVRRGFFPKGGGEVRLKAFSVRHIQPITLTEFGEVTKISGLSFVAGNLPIKIAHAMARTSQNMIKRDYRNIPIEIQAVQEPRERANGPGTGIIIVAHTSTGCILAGSAIGKRGVPAEKVGENAAEELLRNLSYKACTDEHLQDQLIIFMALAKGKSSVCCGPITLHTQTAIHIAEKLTLAKFEVKQLTRDNYIIECDGIGLENKNL